MWSACNTFHVQLTEMLFQEHALAHLLIPTAYSEKVTVKTEKYICDLNGLTQLLTTTSVFSTWKSKINFNLLFFAQCSVYFLLLRFSAMLGALLIKDVCSFLRLPDSHKPSLFKTDTPDFAPKIKVTCIFTRKHLVKWVFILEKFTKYEFPVEK